MKKQRVFILIDGSNFYFKLKELDLHNLLEFDYRGFAKMLARKNLVQQCHYYAGAIKADRSEKSRKLHSNQQKLLASLQKHHFRYSLGYLLKSGGSYHEKGVDVNIAVDMLIAAYENLCDRIILVSSDTDLLPAILKAKEKGKIIEYIGFSHAASLAMVANCSESRLLTREDLLPFVAKKYSQKT